MTLNELLGLNNKTVEKENTPNTNKEVKETADKKNDTEKRENTINDMNKNKIQEKMI